MSDAGHDWGLLEPLGWPDEVSDDRVLGAMIEFECALVAAWAQEDGAPSALAPLATALSGSRIDTSRLRDGARTGGVPLIELVVQLRAAAESRGDGLGEWVHRGATSQDVLDSALVLVARTTLAACVRALDSAGTRLAALAGAERTTRAVARTLTQHAAPTTFGAAVAGWLDGVSSALETLDSVRFPVQLGGAVGTGEAFAALAGRPEAVGALRARTAESLGLDDPARAWHAERTPVLRIADAAATVAAVGGRIGRDLATLSRTEIGEVSVAAPGGSSAMPHKRNPVGPVLLTSTALRAPGLLSTVHAAAVSYDGRPAGEWHAEWQAFRALLGVALESARALDDTLDGLRVDRDAAARNLALDSSGAEHGDFATTQAAAGAVIDAAGLRFARLKGRQP